MQNGLFIDEIWAKIVVGTLSYRWNSILVVGSTRAWTGPSDHIGERTDISQKKSPKNRRLIGVTSDFNEKSPIYRVSLIYLQFIADFLRKIGPPIYLHEMSCRFPPIRDILTIYCRYFATFSSLLMTFKTKSPLYSDLGFTRFLNAWVIFLW